MKLATIVGRCLNRILSVVGLRLNRLPASGVSLDPSQRSIARGLSTKEHNSLQNNDAIYADPHLLSHYFTPERLAGYSKLCDRLAQLDLKPAAVLDVGCGAGHLLAELKSLYPTARLQGFDFSSESIRVAQQLHPKINFETRSIFEIDQSDEKHDLVICSEVLEHLEDAETALEKLWNVCRPGGTVVVTVPDGRSDTFVGHFNFWTPESFRREFRRFGPAIELFDGLVLAIMIRK